MREQRVNIGVMGAPWLKRALQDHARREGRTTSNLTERLLIWSVRQLRVAGDSQTLVEWDARPGGKKGRKAGAPGSYQEVTEQAEDFARAAREMAERPHEGAHEQRPTVSEEDAARHPGRPRRRAHS